MTGFPIVLLILLAVFGSLAAATLPLALGFASVGLTGAGIYFLSQATDMSVFVTNVASMIGIGVAVDYSLFVLARYREEIRAGAAPDEARRVALRTSGLAVTFSGVTVMISLAGLFLVDSTTIRSMAMGAIMVVAVSILAAVTLLPVLMRLLGRRAYARGRIALALGLVGAPLAQPPAPPRLDRARRRRAGFWERWTAARHAPARGSSALASAAVLLALAIPALSLEFGDGALRQFPEGNETRVGAELAAQELGAGRVGADADRGPAATTAARPTAQPGALAAYAPSCAATPRWPRWRRPQPSRDGQRGADRRAAAPRPREPAGAGARRPAARRRRAPRSRGWRTSRSAARPPSSRTSRTSCRARCGRSSCSCCCSATSCCSCCCARCCCR